MGARVWTVEVVEEFTEAAAARFAALGYDVQARVGDGSRGWADHAPYDAVLVTAASATAPRALIDQLRPGGRLVLPLGGQEVQQLSVVTKQTDGDISTREVMAVRFTQLEISA
jgi:protein-L-isoaspartate(D-aspartate) O-methyltransferase